MTTNLFIIFLVAFASASSLLTEAIKKFYDNRQANPSANIIALINAAVVGGLGTIGIYIVMGIPFTPANIVALIAMIVCVWISATIGYDKVIQTIKQIVGVKEQ